MFECSNCGRELKSKAGLVRHERACKVEDKEPIELEILSTMPVGSQNDYYNGHPRRLIKLKGLLSRTTKESERIKIIQMIVELRDENK